MITITTLLFKITSIILLPFYLIFSILEGVINFIKYLVEPFYRPERCKYCGGGHWFTKCSMIKKRSNVK